MQVLLPYESYAETARVLDPSRLGNQMYREAYTLIQGGWPNHVVSKIWKGHYYHLALYCQACTDELLSRGYDDVLYGRWRTYWNLCLEELEDTGPPWCVGHERFHASHRSQLLLKDPVWYGQFGWQENPGEIPYVWTPD